MHFSASKALKVHTTKLTYDMVQLLRFLKSALSDNPWKHGLDFVCDKFVPSLAVEVTLYKSSLDSLITGVLATVVGVLFFVLEVSFDLTFCVERVKAVIIAALESLEWDQWYCHDAEWRCWMLDVPVIGANGGQSQRSKEEGRMLKKGVD